MPFKNGTIDTKIQSIIDDMALDSTVAKEATLNSTDDKVDAILINTNSSDYSGTVSYLDAGAEQTIKEIIATKRQIIYGIWLDLVNMTQDGVIKLYYKIDGTNYRLVDTFDFIVVTDSDGIYISVNAGITNDMKITYTESGDESADRSIVYSIIYETKE